MTNNLLLEAGRWQNSLHDEVWVFDSGFWQKSSELYDAVQKASWDDGDSRRRPEKGDDK